MKLIFHLLPSWAMDYIGNASLPDSSFAVKIFSRINPSIFEYYAGKKLLYMFRRTARLVPAYKKFLQQHEIDPSEIKDIEDFNRLVPQTTKENYIKVYSLSDRCINGVLPQKGSFDESAGTSGTSTFWIRSQDEEKHTMSLMKASLVYLYGFRKENKYIALNCFMLGGWTGGIRFASRVGPLAIIRNIGPDTQKTIRCLKELGTEFTYLISGYPPFIIELIEYGNRLGNINWKEYKINVFTGGEGFGEEWREYVSSQLRKGALIFSNYGAIDLDVGISVETPFTVALRKLLKNDKNLRNEILSSERNPCFIGQYSNQQYYVSEFVSKLGMKELEITVMNLKSVSPNIKYVIGDEGGVMRFQDIIRLLDEKGYTTAKLKHDFNVSSIIPFPIIWLYGRNDGTVSLNGALISPFEIYEAILSDPELLSALNSFKLSVGPDADNFIRLFLSIEARKDTVITETLQSKCNDQILSTLLELNECFRISYIKDPSVHKPIISIVPFQTGIFSGTDKDVKHIYTK